MKKVLFVLPSFNAGGAENYLLRFLPFIQGACTVYVMAPAEKEPDLIEEFRAKGCVTIVDSIGKAGWSNSLRFFRLLHRYQFDAVCTLTGTFGGWPLFISWLGGVGSRVGWHRRSSNAFKASLLNRCYNHAMKVSMELFSTDILSNSATALDYFHGRKWRKGKQFKVIQNGVPFDLASRITAEASKLKFGFAANDFVVGHVGRYDPAKNHELMVKVAALLQNNGKIRFLFCGKDTDGPSFHELIKKYGIQSNCVCIGLHNPVSEVYCAMDLFFFPSLTEGQPNALLEAAGTGLPVLASDIPAIKEATPDWFHCRLISPHNDKAFAQSIECLYHDKQLTAAYRLKDYVTHRYNLERNMNEFKNILLC